MPTEFLTLTTVFWSFASDVGSFSQGWSEGRGIYSAGL